MQVKQNYSSYYQIMGGRLFVRIQVDIRKYDTQTCKQLWRILETRAPPGILKIRPGFSSERFSSNLPLMHFYKFPNTCVLFFSQTNLFPHNICSLITLVSLWFLILFSNLWMSSISVSFKFQITLPMHKLSPF